MSIDVSRLDNEDRLLILRYVIRKYGRDYVLNLLGISKSTLYRIERGLVGVDDVKVRKLLKLLSTEELKDVLSSRKLLESLGIIRSDGTINYSLVMEVLKEASRDEYLKQLIIRFVVDNFREDVKKAIGLFPYNVVMRWEPGFEEFLREFKKRRTIKDPETLRYYRNLFLKYLEGRELAHKLIDYVVNHPNKWLRNVFRHYIQYLYFRRKIPLETYGWLMEVVPSRRYRLTVRVYEVSPTEVVRTMKFLRANHELYYLYYALMYYGGIRVRHAVRLVESFRHGEEVFIEMLGDYAQRLTCYENFCRYYLGIKGGKPCEWVYFPKELLKLLNRYGGIKRDEKAITRYAIRHNLLRPKYLRKINWRYCVKTVKDKDVCRFIQSRLGELKISETRYGDLLEEADREYPKLISVLDDLINLRT